MIQAIEIYANIRSKLDEVKEEFWSESDIILAINIAIEECWDFVYDISEEIFLQEDTINITAGNREADLPANTRYVSNFCGLMHFEDDYEIDYRPYYDSSEVRLDVYKDYTIGGSTGDKFVLKAAPAVNDTITLWYKAPPARISKPDENILLPAVLWRPLTEIAVLHCKVKDENVGGENAPLIQKALRMARSQISKQQGFVRKMHSRYI